MPSQKTASKPEAKAEPKLMTCEVLKAIGIEATKETIEGLKRRADSKGLKFVKEGLTTTIYPAKPVAEIDKRTGKTVMVPGEPVYIDLPLEDARKLQAANAVRAVI